MNINSQPSPQSSLEREEENFSWLCNRRNRKANRAFCKRIKARIIALVPSKRHQIILENPAFSFFWQKPKVNLQSTSSFSRKISSSVFFFRVFQNRNHFAKRRFFRTNQFRKFRIMSLAYGKGIERSQNGEGDDHRVVRLSDDDYAGGGGASSRLFDRSVGNGSDISAIVGSGHAASRGCYNDAGVSQLQRCIEFDGKWPI